MRMHAKNGIKVNGYDGYVLPFTTTFSSFYVAYLNYCNALDPELCNENNYDTGSGNEKSEVKIIGDDYMGMMGWKGELRSKRNWRE